MKSLINDQHSEVCKIVSKRIVNRKDRHSKPYGNGAVPVLLGRRTISTFVQYELAV